MPEGTLSIDLIKAHKLKDVDPFGKSDPFVVFSIGGKRQRSMYIHDGGENPTWNESFQFEIPDGPDELLLLIYDQEWHGTDNPMGSVCIPLGKLFAERQVAPCAYKVQCPDGKVQGDVEVGLKFFSKVQNGVLDVHLLEAHVLRDKDILGRSDPYAVIYCHKDTQKSRVIKNTLNPVWNQHFSFQINADVTDVLIKLFDKDKFTADDPLGDAVVPLHKAFSGGAEAPTKYKIVGPKGQPRGEVSVSLKFSRWG